MKKTSLTGRHALCFLQDTCTNYVLLIVLKSRTPSLGFSTIRITWPWTTSVGPFTNNFCLLSLCVATHTSNTTCFWRRFCCCWIILNWLGSGRRFLFVMGLRVFAYVHNFAFSILTSYKRKPQKRFLSLRNHIVLVPA